MWSFREETKQHAHCPLQKCGDPQVKYFYWFNKYKYSVCAAVLFEVLVVSEQGKGRWVQCECLSVAIFQYIVQSYDPCQLFPVFLVFTLYFQFVFIFCSNIRNKYKYLSLNVPRNLIPYEQYTNISQIVYDTLISSFTLSVSLRNQL